MTTNLTNLIHGRETFTEYYGDYYVIKRPLPTLSDDARQDWLAKQHRTKAIIDEIRAVGNPTYNIPAMHHIHDGDMQILEERAPGEPLTAQLYATLSPRQKYEIIQSIGGFLVDMNELKLVQDVITHKITDEIKFSRLTKFIDNKMSKWFTPDEVSQMAQTRDNIGAFEYETCTAWSHGDLNHGNVLYDPNTSKLSFIDFAEAHYEYIYHDIFAPLQVELDISKQVYDVYMRLHDKSKYRMPARSNEILRNIMKYRIMIVYLKRFIKASDDLRVNPQNEKSVNNNLAKVAFMREMMQQIRTLEQQFSK